MTLLGAVATQRPDSDLDLFIDYDAQAKIPNMLRLMQIEDEFFAGVSPSR